MTVVVVDLPSVAGSDDSGGSGGGGSGKSVQGTIPIVVRATNDPPMVLPPPYHEVLLVGFAIDDAPRARIDQASALVAVTISCDAPTAALRLATPFISDVIPGLQLGGVGGVGGVGGGGGGGGSGGGGGGGNSGETTGGGGLFYTRRVTLIGTHKRVNMGLEGGLVYLRSPTFQGGETFTITVTKIEPNGDGDGGSGDGGGGAGAAAGGTVGGGGGGGVATTSVVSWLDLSLRDDTGPSDLLRAYPTVNTLSPSHGPSSGGTTVIIRLTESVSLTDPLYCQFGSVTSSQPLVMLSNVSTDGTNVAGESVTDESVSVSV